MMHSSNRAAMTSLLLLAAALMAATPGCVGQNKLDVQPPKERPAKRMEIMAPKPTASVQTPPAAVTAAAASLVPDLTLIGAHEVLAAAMKQAELMNVRMDIAVVDAGGNLKAFLRMDGAWLGSIDIAIKKARTARFFDMPTGAIGKLSQPGGPLYQIEASNDGLVTFPGGLPLKDKAGNIVGAVGVSGSTVENDHAVAAAGAAALRQ